MKKFIKTALLFLLLIIPLFLSSQTQEENKQDPDQENLVEVKTLQDLINSKEIEEKKEVVETEKKEPVEKKEIKEEPKEDKKNPVEEKKESVKEIKKTLKIPKQKALNPNVFNGKLTSEDILAEKKGKNTILWIKKKSMVYSVALLSPSSWKLKAKYFLRSPKLIKEQKDNTLWYKGLPLGNNKKLFFLASSSLEKHPLLGKAFKIILPAKVVFGYEKNGGERDLVNGKTVISIRLYKKSQGQGGYVDNLYKIPAFEESKNVKPQIFLKQKQTKIHLVGLSLIYEGSSPNIQRITLENEKDELLLHDFKKNLTYSKYFQIVEWFYNKDAKYFKMKFIVILNAKDSQRFILKIKEAKGIVSYPIDLSKLDSEKMQSDEKQKEMTDKEESKKEQTDKVETKTETKKEEPKKDEKIETKESDKTETKKENPESEVKVEVLKQEPGSDDLNLKVQE